ncbi:MAG: Rieske (2Fe-2S) protein [Silvibacterium sp.]|nr:Rieske (2Fe-2S) protein [Silvibacterium sp.]
MTDVVVGKVSEFGDPGRKVVDVRGKEIGIFQLDKTFYAYHNSCPHMDGPVCQGIVLPLTTEDVDPETCKGLGRGFSKKHTNIVCPWHGMEFDIRTGEHPTDAQFRLRKIPVRVEKDLVYVTV